MAPLRSVSAAFQTALEADATAVLVTLVEIATTPAIYRAAWPVDVTFGTTLYEADGIAHSEISSDVEYGRPSMTLTMQNVEGNDGATLPWSTLLKTGNINGTGVTFRIVSTALLSDPLAVIQETNWTISGWTLEPSRVTLKLGSPHDALALEVPTRPIGGTTCGLNYKQGACTSASTLGTCNKTLSACRQRFGADEALKFAPSYPYFVKSTRRARR